MPMVKRSRTIPISANTWTVPMSEMRFNPWGPISAPATKNPAIEGSRNLWNTKTTAIDTVKITRRFAKHAVVSHDRNWSGVRSEGVRRGKLFERFTPHGFKAENTAATRRGQGKATCSPEAVSILRLHETTKRGNGVTTAQCAVVAASRAGICAAKASGMRILALGA